jgi:hypothetical protein
MRGEYEGVHIIKVFRIFERVAEFVLHLEIRGGHHLNRDFRRR